MDVQYIYVIECAGFHKVGKAFNVPLRLDGLRTGNPFPMMCVYSIAVVHGMARRIEKRAHHTLAAHHHRGEWFAAPLSVCRSAVDEAVAWSVGHLAQQSIDELHTKPIKTRAEKAAEKLRALLYPEPRRPVGRPRTKPAANPKPKTRRVAGGPYRW